MVDMPSIKRSIYTIIQWEWERENLKMGGEVKDMNDGMLESEMLFGEGGQ